MHTADLAKKEKRILGMRTLTFQHFGDNFQQEW
jgi:hypothetical protein